MSSPQNQSQEDKPKEILSLEKIIFTYSPNEVVPRLRMLVTSLRDGENAKLGYPKSYYTDIIVRIFTEAGYTPPPQPVNTSPTDTVIAQKMQLPETLTIFFEGDWKWIGKLTEEQMAKVCAYADRVQDER